MENRILPQEVVKCISLGLIPIPLRSHSKISPARCSNGWKLTLTEPGVLRGVDAGILLDLHVSQVPFRDSGRTTRLAMLSD